MIENFFTSILPLIEHFHLLGYWVAFFAALLETALVVGLLLPGSVILLLLGALSASGHLDFGDLLWFAVAGAVIGDNFNYWLGSRYGENWARDGVLFLTPNHFEQVSRFFDRHGAKSVFLGRFIPSVKEIAPFVAGTVRMRYSTFILWNILGAIGWGLQWVGGGYLFGQSLKLAQVWMSRAGIALIAILLVWVLLWLLYRFAVRQGPGVLRLAMSLVGSAKAALVRNPYVHRLIHRHPAGTRFLVSRIDRTHFDGLPLTVLVLAFAYVLALFAGSVEDLVSSDPIVALDHATAQLVAAFRAPAILPPFMWITSLGDTPIVAALFVVACVLLWLKKQKYVIAGLLTSTLGATAFTALSKLVFERSRPVESILLESSYSFPSGHATAAVAFYGFLGYLLIRSAARWKARVSLLFAIGIFIFLIGLSRIVLGVHYLSDVWAGYLVGTLWLIVGISLTEWLSARGQIAWGIPVNHRRRAAIIGVIAVAAAGFIGYASTRTLPALAPSSETMSQINRPFEVILRTNKLSTTATIFGEPAQPLAFAIAVPDADVLAADLIRSGWAPADKPNLQNLLHLARYGMDYTTAPLAPAFWNNRMNDLAFERLAHPQTKSKSVETVRIWSTSYWIGQDRIFVGVAREYDGIQWRIMHTISPDVDAVAEHFVASIKSSGPFDTCQRSLVPPMIGPYLMSDRFFTRGQLWLLDRRVNTDTARLCETYRPRQ
ncbi:MAG: LssY C-terminal domain-containing protein [Herbaspirillum sp.]